MTSQHNQTAPVSQNVNHTCCNHDSIQPVDSAHQHANQTTSTTVETPAPAKVKGSTDVDHNLSASFQVMGIGMLGIFIFMAIFFGMIKLMEKVFPHKG
ncbi:MAG TPA: hypothetical protein PKY63_07935 [Bacteroidales bacterium]|nr:hypothetical protein [Bacteroidales bacterium]